MKVMYTGTFNPWHRGHQNIYDQACAIFGKENVHVVVAKNPNKYADLDHLKRCIHSALIPRDNVHINTGLTQAFCKAKGFEAIIRGLRGVEDCPNEFTMADWNDDIQTIFLYCNDPILRKVSSSAIKEIEHHDPGSTKRYFSKFFQYYRWKAGDSKKKIYFGKIASGKSTYLYNKELSSYADLDKEIWRGFGDTEIKDWKNMFKSVIMSHYSSESFREYDQLIAKMSMDVDWRVLEKYDHIEASALGAWIRYMPDELLAQFTFVKVEAKGEAIRSERILKRGLTLHDAEKFDRYYQDPPFYDEIVRV